MGLSGCIFSVDVNTCDLLHLKSSALLFGRDVVYIWSVRVNGDECEVRSGCAWLVWIQVWSCSSLHSYLYIVRAGSGPGNGSCATSPSIPGSWLHYFFNCCIILLHDKYWKTMECEDVSLWETYGIVFFFFWLICFPTAWVPLCF